MCYLAHTDIHSRFFESDRSFSFLYEAREELLYILFKLFTE